MKRKPASSRKSLWRVSVETSAEAEDAVSDALQQTLQAPVSSYTDVETRRAIVAAYSETKPEWLRLQPAIRQALHRIEACGLDTRPARLVLKRLQPRDWAESWKRHFKAIDVGSALLIKPSWIRRQPRPGQSVVVLDPGLSFGTGQHPTTFFCLKQLVAARSRSRNERKSFLDIGTGSGILAIAAAKLGYTPVEAFDFDPEAVRIAGENARRNGVDGKIHLHRADLSKLPARSERACDVVCANLISTLLLAERRRIVNRVRPGGMLIIAGILAIEFPEVQEAFSKLGLEPLSSRTEGEWTSGAFTRS